MKVVACGIGLRCWASKPGDRDVKESLFTAQLVPTQKAHQWSIVLYQSRGEEAILVILAGSFSMSASSYPPDLSPRRKWNTTTARATPIFNRPVLPEEQFAGLRGCFEGIPGGLPAEERPEAMDVSHFMHPELLHWVFRRGNSRSG